MTTYEERLAKTRYEKCEITETVCGIPVRPVYSPEDIKDIDYATDIGNPGEYPFTRGLFKEGYRGKLWTRRVFSGLGAPSDSNKRFKYLVEHGETGLHVFTDTPLQIGIDPDHPLAEYHGGTTGFSLATLDDMKDLFEGIPLTGLSVALIERGYGAAPLYAFYLAYAEDQGYDLGELIGSIVNDPLGGCEGLIPWNCGENLDLSVKLCVDILEYASKHTPRWHSIAFNTFDVSQKGANGVLEAAILLSIATTYFDAALKRGLNIDHFALRANVWVGNVDNDFFENIAKFRAVRRMWAKLMKEGYGAKNPRSSQLFCSCHTSGVSLTAQQPVNNIARIAIHSLSAVFAGMQAFDPAGYDEAFVRLSEKSALTSLNIHNILAYETGVASVADPLAGSYYVEWLTNRMEEEIYKKWKEIDDLGGFKAARSKGWIRSEIVKGAIDRQKEIEEGRRIVVGVNDWIVPEDMAVKVDIERDQPVETQIATAKRRAQETREFKEKRDKKATKEVLGYLRSETEKGEANNLIPAMIKAGRAGATIGEIVGVVRMVYGLSYDPFDVIQYPFSS